MFILNDNIVPIMIQYCIVQWYINKYCIIQYCMKFTRYNFDIQYDALLPCFLKGTSQLLSHRHDIISYLYKIYFLTFSLVQDRFVQEIFLSCTVCYNTAIQHKPTSSAVRKWWMMSKLIHNVTVLLTWIQCIFALFSTSTIY